MARANEDEELGCKIWTPTLDINLMLEVDAIQFATLLLEGEAHDWSYHGLVTLGHANITPCVDFT